MSQSKTDKIRERLERLECSLKSAKNKLEFNRSRKVGIFVRNEAPKMLEALEAVVEECERFAHDRDYDPDAGYAVNRLLDIIANELDVEKG